MFLDVGWSVSEANGERTGAKGLVAQHTCLRAATPRERTSHMTPLHDSSCQPCTSTRAPVRLQRCEAGLRNGLLGVCFVVADKGRPVRDRCSAEKKGRGEDKGR